MTVEEARAAYRAARDDLDYLRMTGHGYVDVASNLTPSDAIANALDAACTSVGGLSRNPAQFAALALLAAAGPACFAVATEALRVVKRDYDVARSRLSDALMNAEEGGAR